MEYYLVMKKNKVLAHVKTWVNLKNFMLIERSQAIKDHIYKILFI